MKVFAVDPGTKTGLAWAEVDVEDVEVPIHVQLKKIAGYKFGLAQLSGDEDEMAAHICERASDFHADVVVIEDFILLPPKAHGGWSMDRAGLSPVRITAKVEYQFKLWRRVNRHMRVVKQMPNERTIITDERLHSWGLWRTESNGGGGHAMDALRHLIVYARKVQAELVNGG